MLIDFFYTLRDARVPVTIQEFLTLLEALQRQVIPPSLDDFYHLARLALVKDEAHFDKFDRAFGSYFKGIESKFSFKLFFAIFKNGSAEPIATSPHNSNFEVCSRSVNLEVDLPAGEYVVHVRH